LIIIQEIELAKIKDCDQEWLKHGNSCLEYLNSLSNDQRAKLDSISLSKLKDLRAWYCLGITLVLYYGLPPQLTRTKIKKITRKISTDCSVPPTIKHKDSIKVKVEKWITHLTYTDSIQDTINTLIQQEPSTEKENPFPPLIQKYEVLIATSDSEMKKKVALQKVDEFKELQLLYDQSMSQMIKNEILKKVERYL